MVDGRWIMVHGRSGSSSRVRGRRFIVRNRSESRVWRFCVFCEISKKRSFWMRYIEDLLKVLYGRQSGNALYLIN